MWNNIDDKEKKYFILQLILVFIIIEILDSYLDYILEITILHTIVQIIIYIFLFLINIFIFNKYYQRNIKILLSPELMEILVIINKSENNKVLLNNKYFLTNLKITKPTLKKRFDALIKLNYIYSEKNGNNKYLKLTVKGKSFLK